MEMHQKIVFSNFGPEAQKISVAIYLKIVIAYWIIIYLTDANMLNITAIDQILYLLLLVSHRALFSGHYYFLYIYQ